MIPVTAAGPVIGTKMMLRGFPSSFRRKPESRGGRGGTNHTKSLPPTGASIFIPWCAGGNRHGRLVRKHVPDSDPGSIPAPAGDTNHRRPNNDSLGSQERNVALGLVPS